MLTEHDSELLSKINHINVMITLSILVYQEVGSYTIF